VNLATKHLLLSIPVFFVEGASFLNVQHYYGYHEHYPLSAILLSVAFSVLLAGSVVIAARPGLSTGIKALLILGVIALFTTQAIANISGAFVVGSALLPTQTLAGFWGPEWLHHSSIIFGGVINLVGLLYWVALAVYLRLDLEKRELGRLHLQHEAETVVNNKLRAA
jgi:hypothetical protein